MADSVQLRKSKAETREHKPGLSHHLPGVKNAAKGVNPHSKLTQLQAKADSSLQVRQLRALHAKANGIDMGAPIQTKPNSTGLPDQLKSGVENLSGHSMDDVKVHYNSSKPATLQAHAYAQGSQIHIGPGQEKHLAHEAWHVVQQKQGRVQPTRQLKADGVAINDDSGLEREADVMGAKALQLKGHTPYKSLRKVNPSTGFQLVQLKTEAAVKQELRGGGILANYTGGFISSHLGTGNNTNVKATKIHATRNAPPVTNTVVMNARALKTAVEAGVWVSAGDHWEVTTAAQVALQSTTKTAGAIAARPAAAVRLALTGSGDDAANFTVAGNAVTAITGAAPAEVVAAVAAMGVYPTGGSARALRGRKRDYRQGLVDHINAQRAAAANNATVAWVKANFVRIGGTNMNGNVAIQTIANINAVADRQRRVEVYIGKNSGDIYHFQREF